MVCLLEVPQTEAVKDCGTIVYVLHHSSEQKTNIPLYQTKPEASNPQVVPQNLFHFNRDHICFLLVDVVACTIQMFQLTIKDTAKLGKLELIQKNNISISIPQSSLQTDYLGSFPFLTSKTSEPNL